METNLILIRHGQAVVNVTAVMGGPKGDTGLTELGVRQAEALRERLIERPEFRADILLASTLPRARQTAAIIAPAFGLEPIFDDDLQELRVGPEGDGLPIGEYQRRFGWLDFDFEPFREVDPGGESWAGFMLRVASTLHRIAQEHAGKTVVLVTHGGVVDGSLVHFLGLNPHGLPPARLHTANTSLTHWRGETRGEKTTWRLMRYNDDYHTYGLSERTIDYGAIPATNPES